MQSIKTHGLKLAALALLFSMALGLAACQSDAQPTATAVPTAEPTAAADGTTNITLDGAVTTESGLQHQVITAGTGKLPAVGEIISMNYIISLPDGTELANSYADGVPVTTVWGRDLLLPGWEEAAGLMNVGGKSKFVLPPALAFGEEGYGVVPANSQIVLEMELLSAEPAPQPTVVADDKFTTTESGLKYYDITTGTGTQTMDQATVATDYIVWVKTESGYDYIDSSKGYSPVEFVLGSGNVVFPGWEEGTQGMKVGGKRLLVIPPDLALGDQEAEMIPANSTLVMEIVLVSVVEPQVATTVNEADYTTTESGLKYYDLMEGTGETPAAGQTVVVNYTGWLEDGTVFDTSVGGEPFSFVLGAGNVISGWDEGVASMKVGTKRQLVIPANLAYGDQGAGSVIPGGATLIFEVELLEIQK